MGGDRRIGSDVPHGDCGAVAFQDGGSRGGAQSRSDGVSGLGSSVVDEFQGSSVWSAWARFRSAVHTSFQAFIVVYMKESLEMSAFTIGWHVSLLTFAGYCFDTGYGLAVGSDRTQAGDIRGNGINGSVGFPVASD